MNHWICDDKSPVLPLRDISQMCDGRPPEPKGDHSQVSQKGSIYFLRIDSNSNNAHLLKNVDVNILFFIYIYSKICSLYIQTRFLKSFFVFSAFQIYSYRIIIFMWPFYNHTSDVT